MDGGPSVGSVQQTAVSPEPEALIAEARSRARRRRFKIALTALAVVGVGVATGLAVAGVGGEHARNGGNKLPAARGPAGPKLYTATGPISVDHSRAAPVQLCYGAIASVLPRSACTGIVLRNINESALPNLKLEDGFSETQGFVQVTGTYRQGILTVTRTPVLGHPEDRTIHLAIPCRAPQGGWAEAKFDSADAAIFQRYGEQHPATFGGFWLSDGRVPVVTVTSGVEAARQELSRLYQGDFCVARSAHSQRQLLDAADRLSTITAGYPNRYNIFGFGTNVEDSTVDVDLLIVDDAVVQYVRTHFTAGIVRLNPVLKPVSP